MQLYPARSVRESGGTVLTAGSIADNTVWMRSGTSFIGVTPAFVANTGFPDILRPPFTGGQVIIWDQVISSTNSSQGLLSDTIRYQPHFEEKATATYDAFVFRMAGAGLAGSLAKVALYLAGSDGRPDALLWSSADIDIQSSAQHSIAYSTGSTTVLGDTYKSGNNFVFTRGTKIWKAWMKNATGTPAIQTMGSSTALGLGWSGTNLQSAAFTGFSASRTFSLGYPSTAGSFSDETTNVPLLGLRWV